MSDDVIEVRGVWVIKATEHNGGRLEVLVELPDGTLRTVFEQDAIHDHVGPISYYAGARGFSRSPTHELTEV